ncbi:MAG: HAMP domain-containing protein [Thermoanaerobaculia bacterium]|nr:hypothetical protein [Thermoanaerobaculia bacterium]MCK6683525.1 HAMP domain-containing protein [Thermoanaerobaculia bacterium]
MRTAEPSNGSELTAPRIALAIAAVFLILGVWGLTIEIKLWPAAWGFVTGVSLTAIVFLLVVVLPLSRVALACRHIESGDLSLTVPEKGPRPIARVATAFNALAADFQEVLLLFAHLVRSAEASAHLLTRHAGTIGVPSSDAARMNELVTDIHEMKRVIRDFKYFRVSVEEDAIRDLGLHESRHGSAPEPKAEPSSVAAAALPVKGERA